MPTRGVYSVAIPVIGKRGWGRFSKGGGEVFQDFGRIYTPDAY